MNCFKAAQVNKLCTAAAAKAVPPVVGFSVHGTGISVFRDFIFGL